MVLNPTFIDLFAGCGGLSLGLLDAGWKGVLAVEKNNDAFQTFNENLIKSKKYDFTWPKRIPIGPMAIEDLINNYSKDLESIKGNVDLVAGGPPCQGFSMAGKRKIDDERNLMFYKYLDVVEIISPKFILLENVKGFDMKYQIDENNEYKAAEFLRKGLEQIGYDVRWNKILNAKDCGAPQTRPRFFQFGVKKELLKNSVDSPFDILEKKVLPKFIKNKGISKKPSCRNAISDLEIKGRELPKWKGKMKGFYELPYTKPQTQYQKYMNRGMNGHKPNSRRIAKHAIKTKKRFEFILNNAEKGKSIGENIRKKLEDNGLGTQKRTIVPLNPNAASPTVVTLPDDYIHYNEPRILTVREFARLQTFPDWFAFFGKYTTGGPRRKDECPRYTQVGNAVPPFVAEALGLSILKYYRGDN